MSYNDWYIFYEFDTEDGKIYCYKKTSNQYDYNVGNLDIEDDYNDMYELFTGYKCEIKDYYESPKGKRPYRFALEFENTECRYIVGTYDVFDYRTGKYKNAKYDYKILTPSEFIKAVKPLVADKAKLKAEMIEKIEKKTKRFRAQREKYLQEQEQEYLERREYLPEAEKLLRLFKDYKKIGD